MINKESKSFIVLYVLMCFIVFYYLFQLFTKMEAFIALDHERVIFVDYVKHKEEVLGGKV